MCLPKISEFTKKCFFPSLLKGLSGTKDKDFPEDNTEDNNEKNTVHNTEDKNDYNIKKKTDYITKENNEENTDNNTEDNTEHNKKDFKKANTGNNIYNNAEDYIDDNNKDNTEIKTEDSTKQQPPKKRERFYKEENLPQSPIALDDETVSGTKAEKISIVPVDLSETLAATDIDSMIDRIDSADNILMCTVCGKQSKGTKAKTVLRQHIETHIEGVSHPCNQCDTVTRTSNALNVHVYRNHRKFYFRNRK